MLDTGFTRAVVILIWDRDRGCCARCGLGLVWERRGDDWAIHHREPRGRGGAGRRRWWVNLPSNGVLLCRACHDEVESNRAAAGEAGFLVSALGVIRPHATRIRHAALGWVFLTNDGGHEAAPDEPEAVAA